MQFALIVMFFLLNFSVNIDLNYYNLMQEFITDKIIVRYIRLISVICTLLYGEFFEQLSDFGSKLLFSLFIFIYFAAKFYY